MKFHPHLSNWVLIYLNVRDMKKTFLNIVLLVALTVTACNNNQKTIGANDSVGSASMRTDSINREGVEVGGAMMVASKNIMENASGSSEHNVFVTAVKAAGLENTLSGRGPFTVFAPTNAAFDGLPAGTLDKLLKPENKGELARILTYHVIEGAFKTSDFTDGMRLTTMEGERLNVSIVDGVMMINNARVSTSDVVSSNGIINVVDAVLLPSM